MVRFGSWNSQLPTQPTQTYTDALDRYQHLTAAESDTLHARCRSRLLTHGQQTEHAIVFIHGFTNCPYQFHQLATQIHERGWNTLSVRLPGHGFADRLTLALSGIRPRDWKKSTTDAVDIGLGLGRQFTLFGFSLGGTLAAWAAQYRADLAHAVLVSPAIGIRALSPFQRHAAAYVLAVWPNFYQWWHPSLKEEQREPLHAYPRFASRALSALLRLGIQVQRDARRQQPQARAITVITNPQDSVVDNLATKRIIEAWRGHGSQIHTYTFPPEWELIHDLIDPTQPGQQIKRVYPQLLDWILGG